VRLVGLRLRLVWRRAEGEVRILLLPTRRPPPRPPASSSPCLSRRSSTFFVPQASVRRSLALPPVDADAATVLLAAGVRRRTSGALRGCARSCCLSAVESM
jgi:hypothetical protein